LPSEPKWLPIKAVIAHNRLEVEATSERHFLLDRGLLEGALAHPRNFFGYGEKDVVVLAVALMAEFRKRTRLSSGTNGQPLRRCGCSCVRTVMTRRSTIRFRGPTK
jgi:hypothetical protein